MNINLNLNFSYEYIPGHMEADRALKQNVLNSTGINWTYA